jgi:hypothetical protein
MNHPYSTSPRRPAGSRSATRTADSGPTENSKIRRRVALGLALLLVLAACGMGWYYWRNARLNAVKNLQKEIFGPAGRQLSPDERRQKFEQMRAEEKLLTAAQRQGLRAEGMKRRVVDLNRYFALAKEARTAFLDDLIAREKHRREERQAQGDSRAGGPGNRGGAPPYGGSNSPPGGRNAIQPAQERDQRRENFLDSMPAPERAEWTEFRKDLNTRRQQLGLPTSGRP